MAINGAPYPWHEIPWQRLIRRLDRLPHAFLFTGPAGLGKNDFALRFAQLLLCNEPAAADPCGSCRNCRLFSSATHPDLHVIQSENVVALAGTLAARYGVRYLPQRPKGRKTKSTVIGIDQIRDLIEAMQMHAHMAARKVVVLSPADAMNINAANGLLKLLEEPPPDTFLILVSARPDRLPATVRSRCNRLDFKVPDRTAAHAWLSARGATREAAGELLLELAGGAPLTALAWHNSGFLAQRNRLVEDLDALADGRNNPVDCAARWLEIGTETALGWVQGWVIDLIRLHMSADPPFLYNPDAKNRLQALAKRLNFKGLHGLLEEISEARSALGSALDETLMVEDILIRWMILNQLHKS